VVHLLCDVRGARWLELEVRTRWRVLFLILRSFLCRPHTDRFPDDVLKKLRQNRNCHSCEKNATGTEITGIRRIPAGTCNLAVLQVCACISPLFCISNMLLCSILWVCVCNHLRSILATCSCALLSEFARAICLHSILATCSCALLSGFVHAICLRFVLATCSCALFSRFMNEIRLRFILATCSCALFSRFVHVICLFSILENCSCVL
jgi:hypothetical protein